MKQTKALIALSLMAFLLSLTVTQVYAQTQLIREYEFNSTYPWQPFLGSWNDAPSYDWSKIESGQWKGYVEDGENSDWSDAVVAQGKKPHFSGYYKGYLLISEPSLPYNVADGKLVLQIRMKIPSTNSKGWANPKWICYHNPLVGYQPSAGIVAMVFFEIKVKDRITGAESWRDFSSSDVWGYADLAVCEKFNRWIYNYESGGFWQEVGTGDSRYNYFIDHTTHDNDFHSIQAGWIMGAQKGNWITFTWDVSKDFRNLCAWSKDYSLYGGYPFYIIEGKVKTVMVSVEGYCSAIEGYCEWVTLTYN